MSNEILKNKTGKELQEEMEHRDESKGGAAPNDSNVITHIDSIEELNRLTAANFNVKLKLLEDLQPITIGVAGHVDHGKTTLVAALSCVASIICRGSEPREYNSIKKTEEERTRSITIEVSYIAILLWVCVDGVISKRQVIIADCPGHVDFMNNFRVSACRMRSGIVTVDGYKGPEKQTTNHIEVLVACKLSENEALANDLYEEAVKAHGTQNVKLEDYKPQPSGTLVIAITRIDQAGELEREITRMNVEDLLDHLKVKNAFAKIEIVEICAPWITNQPNLSPTPEQKLQAVNAALKILHAAAGITIPQVNLNKPALISLETTIPKSGRGLVFTGYVLQGTIRSGDKLELINTVTNTRTQLTTVSIESFRQPVLVARPDSNIGIVFKGFDMDRSKVKTGDLIMAPGAVPLYNAFVGRAYIASLPGKKGVMNSGAELPMMYQSSRHTSCFIFLEGLNATQRKEVIELAKKGARINKADPASQKLKDILASTGFKGATPKKEYEILIVVCHPESRVMVKPKDVLFCLTHQGDKDAAAGSESNGFSVKVEEVY